MIIEIYLLFGLTESNYGIPAKGGIFKVIAHALITKWEKFNYICNAFKEAPF